MSIRQVYALLTAEAQSFQHHFPQLAFLCQSQSGGGERNPLLSQFFKLPRIWHGFLRSGKRMQQSERMFGAQAK